VDIHFCSVNDCDEIYELERKKGGPFWPQNIIYEDLSSGLSVYMAARWKNLMVAFLVLSREKNFFVLTNLYVATSFRRKGIASQLILSSGEFCVHEGYNCLRLHVREDNGPARRLYENLGFSLIGTIKNYYEDTGTAFYMEKRLPFLTSS
jgi:ribosomal-protein-alanine N-acetyltransferase